MPDSVTQRLPHSERGNVMAAVAEMAEGGLSERMRLDAATRVLVTVRRMLVMSPAEASVGGSAAAVLRIARGWDPAATTAAEHVEALAPAELDAFLSAAPRWAASVRDATRETRRAA